MFSSCTSGQGSDGVASQYLIFGTNRVTSIANSNSTISRAYFDDNLLNTETNRYGDGINRVVTYTYDPDGRRATLKYPNNAYTFSYTYTGRSQLDTIVSGSTTIANYE